MKELLLIQSELKAPKNQKNTFGNYMYRSCEDILEAVKPLLVKHDCILTIADEMIEVWWRVYVKATAIIEKGENSIKVTANAREAETKKGMDDSQITGSSSSYARKYALNGLFLIDDTKDADATNTHWKEEPKKENNIQKIREYVSKNLDIKGLTPEDAKTKAEEFVADKIGAYFCFEWLTEELAKDIYFKLLNGKTNS